MSNKRDDHRDQEAESISTRSMRVPSSKSRIPASGKVVRLLIVETVTAQGSALHPKRPSFPRMFQVFERELCIAIVPTPSANYNNGLVRVRVSQTMTLLRQRLLAA